MFMDVTSFHDRSIESRGELHTRIDKEKRKIGWWYQLNRSAVFDLYYWCNSWRISIAGAMRKKSLSETGPSSTQLKEFIRQFPKSPKPSDVRRDNADTVERLVRTAFVFYETVGGYTRRDLERWLDEGHMTKEEFTEWMKTLGD